MSDTTQPIITFKLGLTFFDNKRIIDPKMIPNVENDKNNDNIDE